MRKQANVSVKPALSPRLSDALCKSRWKKLRVDMKSPLKKLRVGAKKAPLLNVAVQTGSLKISHIVHAIAHILLAFNEADGALWTVAYYCILSLSILVTMPGLALPRDFFIIWPTRKPIALSLPAL